MKMLMFRLILLCLLKFGQAEEMFTFYRGKSLKETSYMFDISLAPIGSKNYRHCAMQCYFAPLCLAAFFQGELNLCRLYSNINGTTNGEEGDFSMVKKEFGACFGTYGRYNGTNPFSDEECFVQNGYITAVRSWKETKHYLSGIQFRYGSVWGPERGYTGNDAPDNEEFFDSGTFIDKVSFWAGDILDVVTFYSDIGHNVGTHGSSPLGRRKEITATKLMYIQGILTTFSNARTPTEVSTFTEVSFHFHRQRKACTKT